MTCWQCIECMIGVCRYVQIRSRFSNCSLDKLALLRFPDLSFSYHLVIWCDRLSCTSNCWIDWTSCLWVWIMSIVWFSLLYPVLEVGSLHLYSAFGLTAFTVRVIWAWDRDVLAEGPLELSACSWEVWRISACKEVGKSFPELIKYYILIVRARKL